MITIELQVREVATEGLPDADMDVLIFDGADDEGNLGAYIGHHKDGSPIWVGAQGDERFGVSHWAPLPVLRR